MYQADPLRRLGRSVDSCPRARGAEADMVEQHDQYVRSALRRPQRLDREARIRILSRRRSSARPARHPESATPRCACSRSRQKAPPSLFQRAAALADAERPRRTLPGRRQTSRSDADSGQVVASWRELVVRHCCDAEQGSPLITEQRPLKRSDHSASVSCKIPSASLRSSSPGSMISRSTDSTGLAPAIDCCSKIAQFSVSSPSFDR